MAKRALGAPMSPAWVHGSPHVEDLALPKSLKSGSFTPAKLSSGGCRFREINEFAVTPRGGKKMSPIVITTFPGSDLGAQINAADSSLGDNNGILFVPPGNHTISTPIHLHSDKTLHFGAGYYTVNLSEGVGLILFRDNFTFEGDGWNTIIEQPRGMNVVAPYGSTDGPGGVNIVIKDFQLVQSNNPRSSTGGESAIFLGNSRHATVSNLFFNSTWGIDLQIGGTSNPVDGVSHHAEDVTVTNCHHRYVQDDTIKMAVGERV